MSLCDSQRIVFCRLGAASPQLGLLFNRFGLALREQSRVSSAMELSFCVARSQAARLAAACKTWVSSLTGQSRVESSKNLNSVPNSMKATHKRNRIRMRKIQAAFCWLQTADCRLQTDCKLPATSAHKTSRTNKPNTNGHTSARERKAHKHKGNKRLKLNCSAQSSNIEKPTAHSTNRNERMNERQNGSEKLQWALSKPECKCKSKEAKTAAANRPQSKCRGALQMQAAANERAAKGTGLMHFQPTACKLSNTTTTACFASNCVQFLMQFVCFCLCLSFTLS